MEYGDYIDALGRTHAALAAELRSFRGLSGVLAWMKIRGILLSSVEIVQQDEFSLDFVFPLDVAGTHLAFGIT
jgi:hypothetical protein